MYFISSLRDGSFANTFQGACCLLTVMGSFLSARTSVRRTPWSSVVSGGAHQYSHRARNHPGRRRHLFSITDWKRIPAPVPLLWILSSCEHQRSHSPNTDQLPALDSGRTLKEGGQPLLVTLMAPQSREPLVGSWAPVRVGWERLRAPESRNPAQAWLLC